MAFKDVVDEAIKSGYFKEFNKNRAEKALYLLLEKGGKKGAKLARKQIGEEKWPEFRESFYDFVIDVAEDPNMPDKFKELKEIAERKKSGESRSRKETPKTSSKSKKTPKQEVESMGKKECRATPEEMSEVMKLLCEGKKVIRTPENNLIISDPGNPVKETATDKSLSCKERIKAVATSEWALGEAKGLASKLFGIEKGEPGYEKAVKNAAIQIARGAVPECSGTEVSPEEIEI